MPGSAAVSPHQVVSGQQPRGPADCSRILEGADLLGGIAGLGEDRLRVVAQTWSGGAHWLRRCTRQLDRSTELPDWANPGLLELEHHLSSADQLGPEHLVELQYGLQAAVVLLSERLPLGPRAGLEQRLHLSVGGRPDRVELALDEILAADPETPCTPELRLAR